MVNTDGWRGYDGLVDVGFDRHFRIGHGRNEFVQGASHKHPFLHHLKESEFCFNHRYEDLYKLLLKLLRQQPL